MAIVGEAPVSTFEDRLKRWQTGLDFTKSLLIVALVLTFVIYPNALWSVLERAGLSLNEVEFFGAKLTKAQDAVVDIRTALEQALLDNRTLQGKLESTESSLARASRCLSDVESLRNCTRDSDLVEQLKRDEAAVAQSRQLATSSAAAANVTLRNNAAIVQESLARVESRPSSWGIVFGGDVSRRAAQDEIARATEAPSLAIYRKQGSYRSVAVFDTRAAADDWLPRLKKINAGAYVVVLERWCQNPEERDRNEQYTFIECGS